MQIIVDVLYNNVKVSRARELWSAKDQVEQLHLYGEKIKHFVRNIFESRTDLPNLHNSSW